ncbi:MAG: peptidase [Balneolaceae bacterium]|nr:MAG: peptidase [Balneolaceae bacterium]
MKFRFLFPLTALLILLLFSCDNGAVTDPGDSDGSISFNHERNPGASAIEFLTDDDFQNLVLEIQYMEGYAPTSEAISNLQAFLEERLNKNNITILEPSEIPAGGQESYTATEVRNLERDHRTEFAEEGKLAAYFIILDGEFSQGSVLGIAHYNTSMALFGETIRNTSDGIFQLSRSTVETVVMQHEVGHIIGLVNNGVDMQTDHQDEENGRHCNVEDCLMYFAVRTTDFFANIFDGNIPELDEQCIADLQAAGGK